MGLAGPSNKVKIGLDPRNTHWANDTDRFGHQHMLKMGWKPGAGLGSTMKGEAKHIQVKVKSDNVGLGKPLKDDAPTGLDVFQRILGKLNGNEEQVSRQLNEKKRVTGFYLNFIHAGVLEGTIDKFLDSKSKVEVAEEEEIKVTEIKRIKEHKKDKKSKDKKESKSKRSKDKKAKKELAIESSKLKAIKKEKKEKSKDKSKKESKESKKDKKDKKDKKSKKDKKDDKSPSPAPSGIRATRSRYIAMKRQATTDAKSLKEILMLT